MSSGVDRRRALVVRKYLSKRYLVRRAFRVQEENSARATESLWPKHRVERAQRVVLSLFLRLKIGVTNGETFVGSVVAVTANAISLGLI